MAIVGDSGKICEATRVPSMRVEIARIRGFVFPRVPAATASHSYLYLRQGQPSEPTPVLVGYPRDQLSEAACVCLRVKVRAAGRITNAKQAHAPTSAIQNDRLAFERATRLHHTPPTRNHINRQTSPPPPATELSHLLRASRRWRQRLRAGLADDDERRSRSIVPMMREPQRIRHSSYFASVRSSN